MSGDADLRPQVVAVSFASRSRAHEIGQYIDSLPLPKMADFLEKTLTSLGATVEKRYPGEDPGHPGLQLPPVVLSRYGNDPNKRTILVYGHYDVQPALKEDGWHTDPFNMTVDEKDRMFGRGTTDDKGPVLGWINAIEAHQRYIFTKTCHHLMWGSCELTDINKKIC